MKSSTAENVKRTKGTYIDLLPVAIFQPSLTMDLKPLFSENGVAKVRPQCKNIWEGCTVEDNLSSVHAAHFQMRLKAGKTHNQ
jgi:hypothetical protein